MAEKVLNRYFDFVTDLLDGPSFQGIEATFLADTHPAFSDPSDDIHTRIFNLNTYRRCWGEPCRVRFDRMRFDENRGDNNLVDHGSIFLGYAPLDCIHHPLDLFTVLASYTIGIQDLEPFRLFKTFFSLRAKNVVYGFPRGGDHFAGRISPRVNDGVKLLHSMLGREQ